VPDHQRGEQGPHHLGFARPGGADDQPVRVHPAVRQLFEVEHDGGTSGADTDRYPQELAVRSGSPGVVEVEFGDVGDTKDVRQRDGAGEHVGRLIGDQPQRRAQPRQRR
jgi:hypothetical protein